MAEDNRNPGAEIKADMDFGSELNCRDNESVRNHLEQWAAKLGDMIDAHSAFLSRHDQPLNDQAKGRQLVNDYLEKLQNEGSDPQKLVAATQQFYKDMTGRELTLGCYDRPNGASRFSDDDYSSGVLLGVFENMRVATQAYASYNNVKMEGTSPARAPDAPDPGGPAAKADAGLNQVALDLARKSPANWPSLDNLSPEKLYALRDVYGSQIVKDGNQAWEVAKEMQKPGADLDPRKLDEIESPVMKKIVQNGLREGKTNDEILADVQKEVNNRTHFVDQKIESANSSPSGPAAPQRVANVSGPPGP